MKAKYRLKKRSAFASIYKKGKWINGKYLIIVYCASNSCHFGFSISKKFGNAVKRNHAKRQLKECVSKLLPRIKQQYNYIFVARYGLTTDYAELCIAVEKQLASVGLLGEQL
ncbi:MAG: ribonuclease P protein component [Clostridia bacterium]